MPDINVNKLSEVLNTKADIDLNNTGVFSTSGGGVNLTSSTPTDAIGKEVTTADFIKSDIQSNLLNYATNRILEIPQNNKLELNNGTLTLKAGSKLYVPNGFEEDGTTPKFDVIITTQDVTGLEWFSTSTPKNQMVFVRTDGLGIDSTIYTSSGTSYPSSPSNGDRCYRTDLNLLYTFRAANNQWNLEDCLPIAIVQPSSTEAGKISSIDQVFNGFGYIGSTVFALPGVKCQFADGRNEDGSYKSYIKTTDKILTKTFGAETFNGFDCSLICRNDTIDGFAWHVNEDFDSESGYIMVNKTEGIVKNLCPVFRFFINSSSDNGRISQFIPNPVDKLNWKSTELSGMSMPSNKYIDLTLGASGATYTAPANGWFTINKHSTPGKLAAFENESAGRVTWIVQLSAETDCRVSCPARTGDIVRLWYSADGNLNFFRFIYAEGNQ